MTSKKWYGMILAVTALALPVFGFAQEIKISGEMWGRWTNETAKYLDASGSYVNKTSKNYFSLERGYVGLETKFSESTKARFTVDLFSTDATHEVGTLTTAADGTTTLTNKTSTLDGAGLKLKYAYVDFANLVPVPEMVLSTGLQKVYFGTIYDWNYTLIGKAPTDEYKVANSADYGITVNGYIPGGWGEYAAGIYNGEGYKKVGSSLKDNTEFAYLANLRVTPFPGITLGGSYMMNSVEADTKLAGDALNSSYQEQNLMDGIARLAYGPVDVWAEYISKDVTYPNATGKDYTANCIMVMPIVSLKDYIGKDVQLVGRYDKWDQTENASDMYLLNAITAGVNYNFLHDDSANPAMQLQLNYTTKSYDEDESAAAYADGKKDSSQIMMQLKWRFANTIK